MSVVGNDIVDLVTRESDLGSLHPGFMERVLAPEEREWVSAAPDPRIALWTCWTAKEAAYKALRKMDPELVFSPSRFRLTLADDSLSDDGEVLVRYGDFKVSARIERTPAWVHAVASFGADLLPDQGHLLTEVAALNGEDESLAVRRLASTRLAEVLGCDEADLHIEGSRPPQVVVEDEESKIDLSLSHHGNWIAFAAFVPGIPSVPSA